MRRLIEAIPEEDWTPIPYWLPGGADVAETSYTPFRHARDASAVRLIVRRVKPTPGSQLALFATYSYHAFITDRAGEMMELETDHRRHAEIENAIRDLKYGVGLNHLPLGPLRRERGMARGAGDRAQPRPLDGTARARRGNRHHQDAQAALLRPRRTAHPLGPALDPAPPQALALGRAVGSRARATTGDTAPGLTPAHSAGPGPSLAPARPRTPRAPSRLRPQRPRATAPRSGTARRTPARLPNFPAARNPALSRFDRWIRAYPSVLGEDITGVVIWHGPEIRHAWLMLGLGRSQELARSHYEEDNSVVSAILDRIMASAWLNRPVGDNGEWVWP